MKHMKKIWVLIALFFVFLIVGYFFVLRQSSVNTLPTPTPPTSPQVSFRGISAGTSNAQDVMSLLGQPVRQDQIQEVRRLVYESGIGNRPINVEVDNTGSVDLIKEPISSQILFSSFQKDLGGYDAILYGDFSRLGYGLYVYLQRGVAILANPKTNKVEERWFFAPSDLVTFQARFAPDFFSEPPSEQQ